VFETTYRDGFRPDTTRRVSGDMGARLARSEPDCPTPRPTWSLRAFPSRVDPRRDPAAWRAQAEGPEAVTRRPEGLRLYFGTEAPQRCFPALPPGAPFGVVATARPTLAAGAWGVTALSDEALRIWVDGDLLVDAWAPHSPRLDAAELVVERARPVDLRVEFANVEGVAALHVEVHPVPWW